MIKGISIILGYRNRELLRVQKCLDSISDQTYTNFEVVFIDYGSDDNIAEDIKNLVASYPFATYYYNNTKGMPWNRSHALNTGVRLAKNDFILFGDVDLIYAPGAIEALIEKASENTQVYSAVYFLPEGRTDLKEIMAGDWRSIPSSGENGKGGVHLIAKELLEKIRGYDEYYCFWGVEDRDLYSRLDQIGIKSRWVERNRHPVFHQWHNDASGGKKGFFPDRWWENMNVHYSINHNILERNDDGWGKLYSDDDRPVFNAKEFEFDYNERGNWFYKGIVAARLVEKLKGLEADECLKIIIRKDGDAFGRKLRLFNKVIRYFLPRFKLVPNGVLPFDPKHDLIYHLWRLIKDEALITDYLISETEKEIQIKAMSKINTNR